MIVPRIIIELKFSGVTTHSLITYSKYASEIKSMFPYSRYILAVRYDKNSSDIHFGRNGRDFDAFFSFGKKPVKEKYIKGKFIEELQGSEQLKSRWDSFVMELKEMLLKSRFDHLKWKEEDFSKVI